MKLADIRHISLLEGYVLKRCPACHLAAAWWCEEEAICWQCDSCMVAGGENNDTVEEGLYGWQVWRCEICHAAFAETKTPSLNCCGISWCGECADQARHECSAI